MKKVQNISQQAGEYADSIAMRLLRKGKEEGRAEATRLNIRMMLMSNFQPEMLAEALQVPLEQVQEIVEQLKQEGKLPQDS